MVKGVSLAGKEEQTFWDETAPVEEGKLNPLSSIEKKVIKVQNCYRQLVIAAFCILNDFFFVLRVLL